jgi:hypothetical protein
MKGTDPESSKPAGEQPMERPARAMSRQMAVHYANCAMVATSPRDISLFFGRYVPGTDDKGEQKLVELYETQVYMTVDQAEDLAKILTQTVNMFRTNKKTSA